MSRTLFAIVEDVLENALHRKTYYVLVVFSLVLVLMIPLLPSAQVGVQIDLMREGSLGLVSIMSLLLAAILAASLLSSELERRIIYNVLSKPVRRSLYFLGKYLGILVLVLFTLLFSYLVVLAFIYVKFHVFNPGIYKAFLAIFLESALLAAFTLSLSTLTTPVVSFSGALAFYIICHVKGEYLYRAMTDGSNHLLLRGVAGLFYYLLPNLRFFNLNETIAHGERSFPVHAGELLLLLLLAALFILVFLWMGIVLFERKEL